MDFPKPVYKALFPIIRMYWRLIKPTSHGVKILLQDAEKLNLILLVRHSYGNSSLWNLPGGSYKPKRETAFNAANRELREELGVIVGPKDIFEIGVYKTSNEGKTDTVTIYNSQINSKQVNPKKSNELLETSWVEIDSVFDRQDVARVVRTGVRQLRGENKIEDYTIANQPNQ